MITILKKKKKHNSREVYLVPKCLSSYMVYIFILKELKCEGLVSIKG